MTKRNNSSVSCENSDKHIYLNNLRESLERCSVKYKDAIPCDDMVSDFLIDQSINLLFVGEIIPKNDVEFLLDVIRCYVGNYDSNIKLRIVNTKEEASSHYYSAIRKKIKEYRIERNVLLIKTPEVNELCSYYLSSDLFVFAGEADDLGSNLIEALFFGLPIVSYGLPSENKFFVEEEPLFFVKEAKRYAAAVRVLYNNASYRSFLVEKNLKRCEDIHRNQNEL